jgi:hypothetical protein
MPVPPPDELAPLSAKFSGLFAEAFPGLSHAWTFFGTADDRLKPMVVSTNRCRL